MKTEQIQKILDLVKNNYQEIATEFDLSRKKELWPEINNLAQAVEDGERVLDLACGNGRLLEAFSDKKIIYQGIDNSPALIALAQKNYSSKSFIVGDMLNLDNLPDSSFDYIFCLAALQHIPSFALRRKVLAEMRRLINKQGRIIISNWNMWSLKKYRHQLFKNYFRKLFGKHSLEVHDLVFPWKNVKGQQKSDRYYHAFIKKELFKLVSSAKLKIISFKKDKYNFWLVLNK